MDLLYNNQLRMMRVDEMRYVYIKIIINITSS